MATDTKNLVKFFSKDRLILVGAYLMYVNVYLSGYVLSYRRLKLHIANFARTTQSFSRMRKPKQNLTTRHKRLRSLIFV